MKPLTDARVLVTGAASGIGRSLAGACADKGACVWLADIDTAQAESAAAALRHRGRRATAIAMDVTDPDQVRAARARIHASGGPIDILVNCAGTVFGGAFTEVPLDRHLATYRLNVAGLVTVTHTFLPDLIARPHAHLVNIASAAGFIGLPFGSTYASSKWAVIGFSESLRLELQATGQRHVRVTTVCPSFVTTGLFDGVKPPFLTPVLTPDRIAALTIRAIERDQVFVLAPWMVRLTPPLRGLLPRTVFDRVSGLFGVNASMMSWRGREK